MAYDLKGVLVLIAPYLFTIRRVKLRRLIAAAACRNSIIYLLLE